MPSHCVCVAICDLPESTFHLVSFARGLCTPYGERIGKGTPLVVFLQLATKAKTVLTYESLIVFTKTYESRERATPGWYAMGNRQARK